MKQWKFLIAAIAVVAAINVSFAGGIVEGVPKGWVAHGVNAERYQIGLDPEQGNAEHPAYFIVAKDGAQDTDIAAISQSFSPAPYSKKKMRFSAWFKFMGNARDQEIWIRGVNKGGRWSSSNTISNVAEWKKVFVDLQVVEQITELEIGVAVRGKSKVWFKDFSFEEVEETNLERTDPLHFPLPIVAPNEKLQNLSLKNQ